MTTGHASLIKRYVNEVYLTYDSDEAGTRAALRAMPILKEAGITAKIIRMEPYKDPDEFIKNLGTEAFEERINKARNGFLFSLEILEKEYDMNSPEGKTAFHPNGAGDTCGAAKTDGEQGKAKRRWESEVSEDITDVADRE